MYDKSCGNCKYCMKMLVVREGLEPLWVCRVDWWAEEGIVVSPPYDDACEMWEEAK